MRRYVRSDISESRSFSLRSRITGGGAQDNRGRRVQDDREGKSEEVKERPRLQAS
jgi:hypothetical protein